MRPLDRHVVQFARADAQLSARWALPYATFQRARLVPSSAAAARSAPRSSRTTKAIGFSDFALAYASAAATIVRARASAPSVSLLRKSRDGAAINRKFGVGNRTDRLGGNEVDAATSRVVSSVRRSFSSSPGLQSIRDRKIPNQSQSGCCGGSGSARSQSGRGRDIPLSQFRRADDDNRFIVCFCHYLVSDQDA